MSGDKMMRARCDSALVTRIENYREKESLKSDSAAVRKLLVFALDILDRSAEAPAVSNRELMEEIFLAVRENGAMICQAHTYTYDPDVDESLGRESIKVRASAKEFGRKKGGAFLSGEK